MEYLLGTGLGDAVGAALVDDEVDLHAPSLCDVEVAAVLRRALLAGRLSEERAAQALEDHLDLPLVRHGHGALLGRVLGLRENFSAHDAAYVALAEALEASLLTADAGLARAAKTHTGVPVLESRG